MKTLWTKLNDLRSMRFRRDGFDDRTRHIRRRMLAFMQQMAERSTHALEIGELGFDLFDPCGGNRTDGFPVGTVLQGEQAGDFVEGEPEVLSPLDEANATDDCDRVLPVAAFAFRYRQERSLLIVADGLHAHLRSFGKTPNGEGFDTNR
jgi:hypothetical protein